MITAFIGFILSLGIVVFIHEYGHYYVAKSFGVKILEFSIGFGKEIYSRTDKNGVKWRIGLIPLGGFVKMYGDVNPISVESKKVEDEEATFYTKPPCVRFLIVAAGPIANYLLTILLLTSIYFISGKIEVPAIVSEVVKDSPAEKAGLLSGDKIISADNSKIDNFAQLQRIVLMSINKPMTLEIDRSDGFSKIIVTPIYRSYDPSDPKKRAGYLGIINKQEPNIINLGIFGSLKESISDVIDISSMISKAIGQMFIGTRSTSELYGPLTIAKESGKSLSGGILNFFAFIAMISVNLGFINLLPIPVLDGGHLVLIAYEAIVKKPLSKCIQTMLIKIGAVVLIFLIVISVSNDIKSIIF